MRLLSVSWLVVVCCVVAVVLLSNFSSYSDDMEQKQYCEMVAMYDEEAGIGWPDFKGTFEDECNPDGSVKEEM